MCGSNKVAGQKTCDSSVHVPQSQANHFGETKEQRRYIIDYSLPRRSCRVQLNNGRSRSLRPETRKICNWKALNQMVLLYFLIDLAIVNSFITWNCNSGGQRDQLSFRLAIVRQLTVGREIKRRCRSHFVTTNKPGVSGVTEDVRLREVGKYLQVRTTRRWCRHCSTSKHEARTNIMCSHCKVPLCVHPRFEKFHRH